MAGAPYETFTDATWDSEVVGSRLPVLVHFFADWCGGQIYSFRYNGTTLTDLAAIAAAADECGALAKTPHRA